MSNSKLNWTIAHRLANNLVFIYTYIDEIPTVVVANPSDF